MPLSVAVDPVAGEGLMQPSPADYAGRYPGYGQAKLYGLARGEAEVHGWKIHQRKSFRTLPRGRPPVTK